MRGLLADAEADAEAERGLDLRRPALIFAGLRLRALPDFGLGLPDDPEPPDLGDGEAVLISTMCIIIIT